eukprot:GFUD01017527.1.p1 GENE.GFUD01017527.1~~GFUD01017527.1.p1  ORF type:complete len:859 (-),score=181.20 GFUD01017527.1:208-2757(-)
MGLKVLVSLLALCTSSIDGATLPYHDGYDYHFNHMGVHLDLALNTKDNLMIGGKAYVELPVSSIYEFIETNIYMFKDLLTPYQKQILDTSIVEIGKLFKIKTSMFKEFLKIKTIKADITFTGEKVLEGIYDIAVDYTFVLKDGTEEKGTLKMKGEKVGGKFITSVEVVSKSLTVPTKITMICNLPYTHDITVTGSFGKLFINIANDANEVSVRAVTEYLGHQYKYSAVLSLVEKFFTLTYQEPSEQPKTFVIKHKVVNSYPRIEITGYVPATSYYKVGEFKTELIQNKLYDYEVKHTFNGLEILKLKIGLTKTNLEMTLAYQNVLKTRMVVDYTKKMVTVLFPKTNTWITGNKSIEVNIEYQPTNKANPLEGGNIKMVAMKGSVPLFKFGGYFGLIINAAKYELLFKNFYLENALLINELGHLEISTDIIEAKFNAKIFIDLINKYGILNKIAVEAKAEKNTEVLFNIIFTTVETSPKLYIYFPYFLKKVLNIHDIKYLETKFEHVVSGYEHTITIGCNYKNIKFVVKITPTMFAYEHLVGQVSHFKHVVEFKFENTAKSFLVAVKSKFNLHEESPLYKMLYHLSPNYACFKEMTTNYHFEILDKTAMKAYISVYVLKDTALIFHFEFNNMQFPYKIMLKAPYLIVEYKPSTKEVKIVINSVTKTYYPTMTPIGENKFEFGINGEALAHVVIGIKNIEIITLHKALPTITAIFTYKTFSIFENNIGIQILYKQIAHKFLVGWNINNLAKAFMEVKMTGSGTNLLGDYELFHHLNWNIVDIKNFDLIWTGKALTTGLPYLNTPLMINGQLAFNDFVVKMKMVEQYKTETYTLIFETDPFKIAVLPFFTYP